MRIRFTYFEKDGVYYPMIDVSLRRKGKSLTLKALVDSGASVSLFRPEIAWHLGIDILKGKKVHLSGIGGRITGYKHFVNMVVGDKRFRGIVVFSHQFKASFNLLGRSNFFVPFEIMFAEKKRLVVLRY